MASRRGIGRGLSSAADVMLQYFLKQAGGDDIATRQAADDVRNSANAKSLEHVKTGDDILKEFLKNNQNTAQQYAGINDKAPGDITGPVASQISKTDTLDKSLTPLDVVGLYKGQGGKTSGVTNWQGQYNPGQPIQADESNQDPTVPTKTLDSRNIGTQTRPEITDLLAQAKAKHDALLAEANIPTTKVGSMAPDGSTQDKFVPTRQLAGMTVPTGLGAGQKGQNDKTQALAGSLSPEVSAANAKKEGAAAGARSAAEFPFQAKLAQTRADLQLLGKQEMAQWEQDHPKATTQERTKAAAANAALGSIKENRAMLDEMDRQGIMGEVSSRAAEFASGKIKTQDYFKDPAQAKLVADYFSSMKLLQSMAAVAHGGARGGGSPAMAKIFEGIVSGIGDKSIVSGQLDALERMMTKYKNDPSGANDDSDLNIPGLNDPLASFKAKAGLATMKPVPSHKVGG